MSNMSYCRFENTYKDLQDCYEALYELDVANLSSSEAKYAEKLYALCSDMLIEYQISDLLEKLEQKNKAREEQQARDQEEYGD